MNEWTAASGRQGSGSILVTGATGFIGRRLVKQLMEAGYRVRCLVRPSSQARARERLPATVEVVRGDLMKATSLSGVAAGCDGVIHLASISSWREIASPQVGPVVVGGTQRMLKAAREAGVRRFLYVSSTAALGPCGSGERLQEDSANPIPQALVYAMAKRAAGEAVLAEREMETMVAFPAEVYGPGDIDGVTLPNLVRLARQRPRLVPRGGTAVVHLADVVAGLGAILERGEPGGRYLLAGENLSLAQIGDTVLRELGRAGRYRSISPALLRFPAFLEKRFGLPLGLQPDLLAYAWHHWYADSTRTQSALGIGFRPAAEAIRDALAGVVVR